MKLLKTITTTLVVAALTLTLAGCKSGEKSSNTPQSRHETANSSSSSSSSSNSSSINSSDVSGSSEYDMYISSGEPYKQGTFTIGEFYSEWLNIYCDIPFEMRLDEKTMQAIKELNDAAKSQGQFREMMMVNSNSTQRVEIFTASVAKNGTLEQYVKKYYQDIRKSYKEGSVNGMQLSCSDDDFSTYSFLGEDYLLNKLQTEVRRDGNLQRELSTWNLFRVKNDYIIQIQCSVTYESGKNISGKPEDLLSMLTTYDGGKTHKKYVRTYSVYAEQGAEITWVNSETGEYRYIIRCETCGKVDGIEDSQHVPVNGDGSGISIGFYCSNPDCSMYGESQQASIGYTVTGGYVAAND